MATANTNRQDRHWTQAGNQPTRTETTASERKLVKRRLKHSRRLVESESRRGKPPGSVTAQPTGTSFGFQQRNNRHGDNSLEVIRMVGDKCGIFRRASTRAIRASPLLCVIKRQESRPQTGENGFSSRTDAKL